MRLGVRWVPAVTPEQSGRTLPVPVVNLACSGCGWRGAASSLDGLNQLAREHDDSPRRQHIVTLDPPGRWPEDASEFRALLTAPARGSS